MSAKSGQYYRTEQEIAKLMRGSGLPVEFTNPFTRDYAAVKGDIAVNDQSLAEITAEVGSISSRVDATESEIAGLNSVTASLSTSVVNLTLQASDFADRLTLVETDLSSVIADLASHEAQQSAHGATGDIVGTGDYCTLTTGGTVLMAAFLGPSPTSTLLVTSTPTAPSAAYVQAEAVSWVAVINELKTDFNALVDAHNALVGKLNAVISTQKDAKQRAP